MAVKNLYRQQGFFLPEKILKAANKTVPGK